MSAGRTPAGRHGATLLWASPPVVIGDHEWRTLVYEEPAGPMDRWLRREEGRPDIDVVRFTGYEWRRPDSSNRVDDGWYPERAWPSYDFNDGTYAGCPKSLATKLYMPHRATLARLLDVGAAAVPEEAPVQGGLFS